MAKLQTPSGESKIPQAESAGFEPSWKFFETVSRKLTLANYAQGGRPKKIMLFETEVQ
jgi:hypothetical protein